MRERPVRRHPRLKGVDYSQSGAYFFTICTRNREPSLGRVVVGPDALIGPSLRLSAVGGVVERHILAMEEVYSHMALGHYMIMPNHIHLLLCFYQPGIGPMRASGPTLGSVVRSLKGLTTRAAGRSLWQSSYYDHIIRDEADYLDHWRYIEENPARWAEDEYFINCEE